MAVARGEGSRLRLYADRRRQLHHADPDARTWCSAAARPCTTRRWRPRGSAGRSRSERCPDADDPDLLATLDLAPGRIVPAAEARLGALQARSTDRRRFTSWPLPAERLDRLSEQAEDWGAIVVPLVEPRPPAARRPTSSAGPPRSSAATRSTPPRPRPGSPCEGPEGVPAPSIPEPNPHRPAMPSRYQQGELPDPQGEPTEFVDGLVAMATVEDDPLSWLRAGETLSALWLATIPQGLSLLPLSQVAEVPETREELRDVLGGTARPQLLVRLGWQEMTRGELPRTPRRPVEEVLRFG